MNNNRYVCEMLQVKVFPFHQGTPGAIFQQDNTRTLVAKTDRDFYVVQNMQPLSQPAYSPVMWPIEHVSYLINRRLARDPRPAASKDNLWLRKQAIRNSLNPLTTDIAFSQHYRYL